MGTAGFNSVTEHAQYNPSSKSERGAHDPACPPAPRVAYDYRGDIGDITATLCQTSILYNQGIVLLGLTWLTQVSFVRAEWHKTALMEGST